MSAEDDYLMQKRKRTGLSVKIAQEDRAVAGRAFVSCSQKGKSTGSEKSRYRQLLGGSNWAMAQPQEGAELLIRKTPSSGGGVQVSW